MNVAPEIISGICLLLSFVLLSYLAYTLGKKRQYRSSLMVILMLGLTLRVFVASDPFLHNWDERYHALVAKNTIYKPLMPTLYKTPLINYDYKNWSGNHVWLHKQPAPLWIMASSIWLFGNNIFGLRLPSVLVSILTISLVYAIGKEVANKKVGLLAAYFCAINGLLIELTGGRIATDHVDTFFLFFISLSIYLSILFTRKKLPLFLILSGVAMGLSVLTKWLPGLIVLPVFIVYNYQRTKRLELFKNSLILFIVGLAIFLPWQIFTAIKYPLESAWEQHYNWLHLTTVLSEQTGPWYYFIAKLRIHYGELIYLPLIWFIYKAIKTQNEKHLALLTWVILPIAFFSFSATKMQAYTVFICPSIFIILAISIHTLRNKININEYSGFKKIAAQLVLFLLVALPTRYSIERIKPFSEKHATTPLYMTRIQQINELKTNKIVVENCNYSIETMFFTNVVAYEKKLTFQERKKIIAGGYQIIKF